MFVLDIMVISCEEDEPKVETLKEIISKFSSERKLIFCPEPMPGQSRFSALQHDLENSQYIFMFLGDGSQEDGWVQFQQDAALMKCIRDHTQYIVPVKSHSHTTIPCFLQKYHALELSTLLKGKPVEQVKAKFLTEDDVNMFLMKSLITAVDSKAEKLVTKVCILFILFWIYSTENNSNLSVCYVCYNVPHTACCMVHTAGRQRQQNIGVDNTELLILLARL